jgi:hypothetical protein
MLSDSGEYLFTCKECGNHDLYVIRNYAMNSLFRFADHEELMGYEGESYEEFEQEGEIEHDHRFLWSSPHSSGVNESIVKRFSIDKDDISDYPEEKEYDEPELEKGSEAYYLYCRGCNREIEFGWTQPNREGRIWPVEYSDFDPRDAFPEPRYKESWEEKGWL